MVVSSVKPPFADYAAIQAYTRALVAPEHYAAQCDDLTRAYRQAPKPLATAIGEAARALLARPTADAHCRVARLQHAAHQCSYLEQIKVRRCVLQVGASYHTDTAALDSASPDDLLDATLWLECMTPVQGTHTHRFSAETFLPYLVRLDMDHPTLYQRCATPPGQTGSFYPIHDLATLERFGVRVVHNPLAFGFVAGTYAPLDGVIAYVGGLHLIGIGGESHIHHIAAPPLALTYHDFLHHAIRGKIYNTLQAQLVRHQQLAACVTLPEPLLTEHASTLLAATETIFRYDTPFDSGTCMGGIPLDCWSRTALQYMPAYRAALTDILTHSPFESAWQLGAADTARQLELLQKIS